MPSHVGHATLADWLSNTATLTERVYEAEKASRISIKPANKDKSCEHCAFWTLHRRHNVAWGDYTEGQCGVWSMDCIQSADKPRFLDPKELVPCEVPRERLEGPQSFYDRG